MNYIPPPEAEHALEACTRLRDEMLRLERQRDNAILAAIENGASVRAVSRAIGVNHETTRQIVRELRAAS